MALRRPLVLIGGRVEELPLADSLPGGAAGFYASASAPADPAARPLWFALASGAFLAYVDDGSSSQWVEIGANVIPGGGAIGHTLIKTSADDFAMAWGAPTVAWADLTGKPATFAPSTHNHGIADVTGLQTALDGKQAALASTDALVEGATNLYFTAARVRAAVLTGLSTATNAAVAATDTVLEALGKLQAQISAHFGAGGTAHAAVVASGASGFMSGADKAKLDGVAAGATANTGTVTSVGLSAPTGFSVAGSPVAGSGTLALSFSAGYSLPTDTAQAAWAAKQDGLVSGTNIKTVNGQSLLGAGDLVISGGGGGYEFALAGFGGF